MPLMLSKTYDALRAAGASEDQAREAAEEPADYESRLAELASGVNRIDAGLSALRSEVTVLREEMRARFSVLTWAIGVNAAATIAILGVLLHH
ncbi:MAG: hypothetical protein ACREE9_19520 [Stellaceae bacterium]